MQRVPYGLSHVCIMLHYDWCARKSTLHGYAQPLHCLLLVNAVTALQSTESA